MRALIPALLVLAAALTLAAPAPAQSPAARYAAEARRTVITRDDWGIAHIHGRSDADAVFGMIYAQCEDDFPRVEANYLTALGRTAEAEGEPALWADLRQRLFISPEDLQKEYTASPPWLQSLMNAWADGINFYLAQHPAVHPRVLTHFEPWMALSFTEGSIGGDIERVDLKQLQAFYSVRHMIVQLNTSRSTPPRTPIPAPPDADRPIPEPGGSNGVAIAPSNTLNHHALLLINPHTSFFFRSELQMTSDAGLNAYGAVTWGQFFVYQGFNDRAGWMHTSSNVDAVDEYIEDITPLGGSRTEFQYKYGEAERPVTTKEITLQVRTPAGALEPRTFTVFYTGHGPVIREQDNHWITIQLMQRHIPALEQSYLRTKARNYDEYKKTMALFANSSNNTVYADADGTIAYWHGNFIPRRDPQFDYTHPVDGSDPATDWHGLLTLDEIPHLKNPASGYLFNVNNAPWAGAGKSSLKQSDYPVYVEQGTETSRGIHAERVFGSGHTTFTVETLRAAAFDSYLPWFARTIPALFTAYDALPPQDPQRTTLAPQIAALRTWNFRWSAGSIPTSLAVFWGEAVGRPTYAKARAAKLLWEDYVVQNVPPATLLNALQSATERLTRDFGTWQTPWGQINRFQRLTADIVQPFSDSAPSIPVPFTSSQWGSLAAFAARPYPQTKRWYGTAGNSFVAVVEFGPQVHAIAVTAGGESGHPTNPHFDDEAQRYASGNLREVYFYPMQLHGHTESTYHPGQKPKRN